MKRICLSIVLLVSSLIGNAQTTHNPVIGKGEESASIEEVYVKDSAIIVFFNFYDYFKKAAIVGRQDYVWFSISPKTTLNYIHPQTREEIKVPVFGGDAYIHSSEKWINFIFGKQYFWYDFGNMPVCPKINLFFKHTLPDGVSSISIHENIGKKSYYWRDIIIRPVNHNWMPYNFGDQESIDSLIQNSNTDLSGIYMNTEGNKKYTYAFFGKDNIYGLVEYTKGNGSDANVGDLIAAVSATASPTMFIGDWYDRLNQETSKVNLYFENGQMIIQRNGAEENYIKVSGLTDIPAGALPAKTSSSWSGSGFALNDGFVITNYHVVDGANKICIFGINGDFSQKYDASVVGCDKVNDLALLKLSSNLKNSQDIPYSINLKMADVGEDIFVLGYPLTQLLGNEIKLTNGIISSKTGFDRNVNNYQISAPVQPGNSGGPMFNKDGNIIGVVVAGISNEIAQNANYAIKTSCIKTLIESVADISILPKGNNSLKGLSLPEQSKRLKEYIYYIECSK